jgi:transposase
MIGACHVLPPSSPSRHSNVLLSRVGLGAARSRSAECCGPRLSCSPQTVSPVGAPRCSCASPARPWSIGASGLSTTGSSLAPVVGLSHSTVQRIWKEHGLQPHRSRTFKHSTDPRLEEKLSDVVGLYLHPPEQAVVICVDEKSQIQALDRTQPLLPMRPGQPERRTHDYVRHGTTTLFAGLDIASGEVTGRCYERHRHQEFLRFLDHLARAYPRGQVHLVMDNYSTHTHPKVADWLRRHRRFHLHFTPTSASWLNQVETFFSILQRRAIKRGVFRSVVELKHAIQRFLDRWNDQCRPFAWVKTPEQLLGVTNGLRSSESQH